VLIVVEKLIVPTGANGHSENIMMITLLLVIQTKIKILSLVQILLKQVHKIQKILCYVTVEGIDQASLDIGKFSSLIMFTSRFK